MITFPKTLTEAIRYYSDTQTCINAVAAIRWADGKPVCPKCNTAEGDRKHYWLKTQRRWKCYSCRKQFSVKVNSVFEDSPLGLDVWMVALWMLCNCRNGVSSYEIARATGIAQKSAWHLLHRLRSALQPVDGGKLGVAGGVIEVDESFIGGKARNMHTAKRKAAIQGRGATGKTVVMGMLERGGKVRTMVVANRDKKTLQGEIQKHVAPGADVMTDELLSYDGLHKDYTHRVINHAERYVDGMIHTNGMENYWSLVKRALHGTYVSVEPFHLFRYLDEQAFRYNNREGHNDGTRFQQALSQVGSKRLTWDALTGKGEQAA
jgi:transposase-like protein